MPPLTQRQQDNAAHSPGSSHPTGPGISRAKPLASCEDGGRWDESSRSPTSREQCPKSSDAVGLLADRCAQIVQDLPSHADLGSGGALDGLDAALRRRGPALDPSFARERWLGFLDDISPSDERAFIRPHEVNKPPRLDRSALVQNLFLSRSLINVRRPRPNGCWSAPLAGG